MTACRRPRTNAAGVILAVATAAFPAVAADDLVGDRPDFTESAATIAPGRVQLEAGYTYGEVGEARSHSIGEILVRVGLHERAELRLGLNSYGSIESGDQVTVDGLEDASLGVKLMLAEGGGGAPALALILATSLPTGADGIGADAWQPEAVLAAAYDLSSNVSLGVNAGAARPEVDEESLAQLFGSIGVGFALSDRWGAFLEWFGFDREVEGGPGINYGDAGLTCLVGPDLQLDVRVGQGFNSEDTDWFVGVGTVARW